MFIIEFPPLYIFQSSWLHVCKYFPKEKPNVPVDCKLANTVLIFKKVKKKEPGNCRPVGLTSVPGKITEKVILGVIEKPLRDNRDIGHSQAVGSWGESPD